MNNDMDGMITITKEAYISLRKAEAKLNLLEAGGVDNWVWYGDSLNPSGEPSYSDICEDIIEEVREDGLPRKWQGECTSFALSRVELTKKERDGR